jgi:hypothetical protein
MIEMETLIEVCKKHGVQHVRTDRLELTFDPRVFQFGDAPIVEKDPPPPDKEIDMDEIQARLHLGGGHM